MKSRVLLFACIEKNIGDDLFVKTLCERYPNTVFEITSSANYGMLADIPNLRFSLLLKYWMFISAAEPKARYKVFMKNCLEPILRFCIGKRKTAVWIVGNAFKNYHYRGLSQSEGTRKRVKLAESFYLLSTNFGPYYDERWLRDCKTIFAEMTDLCFRDKSSYELFRQIPSARYAPDAILSLGKIRRIEPDECEKETIIISVIDCSTSSRDSWLKKLAEVYETKMAEIANKYLNKGTQIILLDSNTKQDFPAAKRIFDRCIKKDDVRIVDYDGDIAPVFDIYRKASGIIATRLHTIILAWLHDLPVFPIVYDIKVENVLKSYGFAGNSCWIDKIEELPTEYIVQSLEKYDFLLPDDIICDAHDQFQYLDQVLK